MIILFIHRIDHNVQPSILKNSILGFREKYENKIGFGEESEAVVVLGKTHVGKSTFVRIMTTNSEKLVGVQIRTNFVINDNNTVPIINNREANVIGQSTGSRSRNSDARKSKTIIPEFFTDPETNVKYFDCPGFEDNRSAEHDINAMYFLHKLLRHLKDVKFLFIIDHSMLDTDITSLKTLLAQASRLFNGQFESFKDSVALIVNKVPIGEDDVKSYIAEFAIPALQETQSLYTNNSMEYDLIKCFVEKIGILHQPDSKGPITQSRLIKEDKINIQNIVKFLKFEPTQNHNFGLPLSNDSIIHINQLFELVKNSLRSDIQSQIIDTFDLFFNKKNDHTSELNLLAGDCLNAYNKLLAIDEHTTPALFLEQFEKQFQTNETHIPKELLSKISEDMQYYDFLKTFDHSEVHQDSVEIFKNNSLSGLKQLEDVYRFLFKLQNDLFSYSVQKNIKDYDAEHLIKVCDNKEKKLSEIGLSTYLNNIKCDIYTLNLYMKIKDINLNTLKLTKLKGVLTEAFTPVKLISITTDQLIVIGNCVMLSDILKHLKKHKQFKK